MTKILNSIPLLYLVMLIPGRLPLLDLFTGAWYYPQMMLESGEISIWYLVLTLAVTPMLLVINIVQRGKAFGVWLLRRRKHFGLLSFIFAAVHALHYLRHTYDLTEIWYEAVDLEFLVGWLAFLIFVLLAVTSNRYATRRLGRSWKPLHRLIYPCSALAFLHWYFFVNVPATMVFWAVVLVLIKALQVALHLYAKQSRAAARDQAQLS